MAAASTKRYAEGNPLSVIDGIPVAVKEEYDVVSCYGYLQTGVGIRIG